MVQKVTKPLPFRQLAIICICRFAVSFAAKKKCFCLKAHFNSFRNDLNIGTNMFYSDFSIYCSGNTRFRTQDLASSSLSKALNLFLNF